ncbi:amblin-like [Amblyomma americanum]
MRAQAIYSACLVYFAFVHAASFRIWPRCWRGKAVGSCGKKIPSWYYDFWSGKCKGFLYSGCGGNPNRFSSEVECQRWCIGRASAAEFCSLKPIVGNCESFIPSWFYDPEHDCCRGFIYGGCKGNHNRFRTCLGCMERCSGNTKAKKICKKRIKVFQATYNLKIKTKRSVHESPA